MTTANDQLQDLLTPAIDALGIGVSLWGIEYAPGHGSSLLRIYIDAGERPVTLDDCEAVSREISALLDVEDPIPGAYTLEVSSPGLERPLFSPEQFARFIGEPVRITLGLPLEGRRRLQGRIERVVGDDVVVLVDGDAITVPHVNIQKAKLAPALEPAGKPTRRPGGARRKPNNSGAA